MKLFAREKVRAISRLRVVAGWSGLSSQTKRMSAVYTVPDGFAVIDYDVIIHSSNNGSRSVDVLGEGIDLVTSTEVNYVFNAGINAAASNGKDDVAASLEQKKEELYKSLEQFRSSKSVIKANVEAQAHGSFVDRRRGWEEISVDATLIWLGGSDVDSLASSLEEEFGIDIPEVGIEKIIVQTAG